MLQLRVLVLLFGTFAALSLRAENHTWSVLYAPTDTSENVRLGTDYPWSLSVIHRTFESFAFGASLSLAEAASVEEWRGGMYHESQTPGMYLFRETRSYAPQISLFANYFPFDSPLYLSVSAGRAGGNHLEHYGVLNLSQSGQTSRIPSFRFTAREEFRLEAGFGAGVRHVFSSGLTLGAEWIRTSGRRTTSGYMENSVFSPAPLSPEDLLVLQAATDASDTRAITSDRLTLQFGFSF